MMKMRTMIGNVINESAQALAKGLCECDSLTLDFGAHRVGYFYEY